MTEAGKAPGGAVYLGVVFAFALGMIGTTMPTPLYPLYQQAYGYSQLMITVIFAVYALGVLGALLVTGRWSDQLGRRPLLLAALVLSAFSDLIFAWANGLGFILAGRIVSGLSAGILTGTATVALMELVPAQWRKWATFAATAANMGGLGLGPILSGAISVALPMPVLMPFVLHFLLALVALVCIWRAPETAKLPDTPRLTVQRPSLPPEVRAIFLPASIAAFAGFMVCGFFTAMAPAFLGHVMGITGRLAIGAIAGMLFICSTIGQLLMQRLPDGRQMIFGTALLLAGVVILGLGFAGESLALLLPGVALAGAGQGISFRSGMGDIAGAARPQDRAGVISTYFIVAYVAISLPVVGIGLLSGAIGLKQTGELFAVVVTALLVLALVMLGRLRRRF